MDILVLCTGNRCRSQMAEGIIRSLLPEAGVFSAGVKPAAEVHPLAVRVMAEIGIDISENRPKSIDLFLERNWDYVITVCSGARDTCPVFEGNVKNRLHIGFEDPDSFKGSEEQILPEFRRIRDEITAKMRAQFL